jgi:hypothetical protein
MASVGGLAAAAGAVVLFGTFPLATKTAPTGDGIVFQLLMCLGIYTVGIVTHFVQCATGSNAGFDTGGGGGGPSCPQFVPLASAGGAIWCVSNLLLVPIVDTIGVGLTMMVWGMAEMLTGWATGKWGAFGLDPEPIASPGLNYVGVLTALGSLLVLVSVRPNTVDNALPQGGGGGGNDDGAESVGAGAALLGAHDDVDGDDASASLAAEARWKKTDGDAGPPPAAAAAGGGDRKWTDALSPPQRRTFGVCAALVAGTMSGSTFTPPQRVVDATANWIRGGRAGPPPFPGASTALFDLLFSHFTGIMLTSVVVTAVYAAARRNRPQVYAEALLPAYVSGLGEWWCGGARGGAGRGGMGGGGEGDGAARTPARLTRCSLHPCCLRALPCLRRSVGRRHGVLVHLQRVAERGDRVPAGDHGPGRREPAVRRGPVPRDHGGAQLRAAGRQPGAVPRRQCHHRRIQAVTWASRFEPAWLE